MPKTKYSMYSVVITTTLTVYGKDNVEPSEYKIRQQLRDYLKYGLFECGEFDVKMDTLKLQGG